MDGLWISVVRKIWFGICILQLYLERKKKKSIELCGFELDFMYHHRWIPTSPLPWYDDSIQLVYFELTVSYWSDQTTVCEDRNKYFCWKNNNKNWPQAWIHTEISDLNFRSINQYFVCDIDHTINYPSTLACNYHLLLHREKTF